MKISKPILSVFTKTFLIRYFVFIVPVTIMVLILTISYEKILHKSIEALPLEYSQQITDAIRGILLIHAYAIITILFFFFFVVLGTLLSIWWTFRPTLKLLKAMDSVAKGDFSVRLHVDSNDEIGRIFKRFNAMTEGLEDAKTTTERLERIKFEFISGSAFHLRSILGASKWSLDGFMNMPREQLKSVSKELPLIERAYDSTNQGIKAIQEILDLAELESQKIEYNFAYVDINEFFYDLGEEYKAHTTAKNIDFAVNSTVIPGTKIYIDAVHTRIALRNFLLNAVQFTNPAGKIEFGVKENSDGFIFTIHDSGVGIPKNELPKIFGKFFRGEQALRLGLPGLGIGMYVSKLIIEKHGGTIAIESEVNSGTTVTCFIPQKKE